MSSPHGWTILATMPTTQGLTLPLKYTALTEQGTQGRREKDFSVTKKSPEIFNPFPGASGGHNPQIHSKTPIFCQEVHQEL